MTRHYIPPNPRPRAALKNYLRRPKRTQREQIVVVPSAPEAKAPKMKERRSQFDSLPEGHAALILGRSWPFPQTLHE